MEAQPHLIFWRLLPSSRRSTSSPSPPNSANHLPRISSSCQLPASLLTDSVPAVAFSRSPCTQPTGSRNPSRAISILSSPPRVLVWVPSLGRRSYRSPSILARSLSTRSLPTCRLPSSVSGASCKGIASPIPIRPRAVPLFSPTYFRPRSLSRRCGRIPGHASTKHTMSPRGLAVLRKLMMDVPLRGWA